MRGASVRRPLQRVVSRPVESPNWAFLAQLADLSCIPSIKFQMLEFALESEELAACLWLLMSLLVAVLGLGFERSNWAAAESRTANQTWVLNVGELEPAFFDPVNFVQSGLTAARGALLVRDIGKV